MPDLVSLAVVKAEVILPGIGLGACTALTELEMQLSKITSAESRYTWDNVRQRLQESMSTMLSLTDLAVLMYGETVCLEQFSVMPGLTSLHLMHHSVCSLAGDVAALGRLRKLEITGPLTDSASNVQVRIAPSFDFDWKKLKGLQAVHIRPMGPATFGNSILQVTQLPQLLQFELLSFTPGDTVTVQCVAALSELFAKRRPEVDVVIKDTDE